MEAVVKAGEMHAVSEEEKPLWGCPHGRDGEGEYSLSHERCLLEIIHF